jgi:very-short-patch-repair endonuclease
VTVALPRCPEPTRTVLHRTKRWDPIDRKVHRRVPVTSINRTLIDYGATVPRLLLERAVEDAFNRRLTTEGALRRRLAVVGGHGCRGAGKLRWVLDHRPRGKPARSGFEVILRDVLRQFGLDADLWRNYEVMDEDGRIVAEVDLAEPVQMIALEADGARWHSTRRAHQRDIERQEMLEALGWIVERFTWDDVIHHPERVAARVRELLCRFAAA